MKVLFDLAANDCHYVMAPGSRDTAGLSLFCAEPAQADSSYCPSHHRACHAGFGKDWQALAGMMDAVERRRRSLASGRRRRAST